MNRTFRVHVTNDPMFMENGYTVSFRDGGPCWVIDPGLPPQAEQIIAYVRERKLELQAVVLTHAHGDHIAGIDDVREALGMAPLYLAQTEWPMLTDPNENLSAGMGLALRVNTENVVDLPEGGELELDGSIWRLTDTSGHSPGGRSLYCSDLRTVIVGDALFQGSVGRVDFHHSDGPTLLRNIREKLMALPDETRVLSGHGPETTIGTERRTNPFVIHGF